MQDMLGYAIDAMHGSVKHPQSPCVRAMRLSVNAYMRMAGSGIRITSMDAATSSYCPYSEHPCFE